MEPLVLNVKLLKIVTLWPIKNSYIISHAALGFSFLSASTEFYGFVRQFRHLDDIGILINQTIGLGAFVACIWMSICLIKSVEKLKDLMIEISNFSNNFGASEILVETEKKTQLVTKVCVFYGFLGNLCYAIFPLFTISSCEKERQDPPLVKERDPCGLIVRVWYPLNVSEPPLFYVAFFLQLYACIIVSMRILVVTMLLVGMLMYAVALLKHCGECVKKCCDTESQQEREDNINFCIRYHIAIILYSDNLNKAFSSMMLSHITLTSFEISILGFQVIMVESPTESLRYGMHLFGWLILLFLVCLFGQMLIDESLQVAVQVYDSAWTNATPSQRKKLQLMILRSQKPLTLSAASLGVMSLETYLSVISTAYSYLTLLLNVKETK